VFACICRAVTTDQVSTAIENGAVTMKSVARATGACTGCGMCGQRIRAMLSEHSQERQLQGAQLQVATAA
jgi:bacterioferritin-associated ferredoxin